MKTNRIFKILVISLLLILFLAAGLVAYFKLNPKQAINLILPEINQISFVKAVIRQDTAHIEVHTLIQNKSFYTLKIDSLYYEIKLKDFQLPEEKLFLNLKQKRYQIDTVQLPLKLPMKKIRTTIKASQEEDSIQMEGNFHVLYNTFFGRHTLSFKKNFKLSTPVPPEINVLKVEHRKIKLSNGTVNANIVIQVKNKGKNLNLITNNIRYKFRMEDLLESSGTYTDTVIIKPGSETTISIPLSMKIGKLLKAGWLILKDKDRVNYTVTIEADLEEQKSLSQKIPLQVTASGITEIIK